MIRKTNTKKRQKYKHKDKYKDRHTHTDTEKYQIHNRKKIRTQKVKCSNFTHQLLVAKVLLGKKSYLGFPRSDLSF